MTKKMIEAGWESFRGLVIPRDAGSDQLVDMRRAFYCGATLLFLGVLHTVSEGEAITDEDMETMAGIQAEIDAFGLELDAALLATFQPKGRPS